MEWYKVGAGRGTNKMGKGGKGKGVFHQLPPHLHNQYDPLQPNDPYGGKAVKGYAQQLQPGLQPQPKLTQNQSHAQPDP